MTTSYDLVKKTLTNLLNHPDYKVIALKGKWGTGKTHLWRSIDLSNHAKKPIYISLFGARSIKDLKLRIIQNIASSDKNAIANLVGTGAGIASGLIKRFTGYSAEDGVLLWVSNLTKDRLIVIDDLERKHASLDTDEVMGFLSEYSETHGTRFLVLLNLAKLQGDTLWAGLHEKVIDGEVTLNPTSVEAFDIAAVGKTLPYHTTARDACAALGLTNIRVIRNALRILDQIAPLGGQQLTDFERWVPSTMLLVAIHFRAIEDPPSFEFISSFGPASNILSDGDTDKEKKINWSKLLQDLGIVSTDEYERIVFDFLQTGVLDEDAITKIFDRYRKQKDYDNGYQRRRAFYVSYWWDPTLSTQDLVATAIELADNACTWSAREISDFVSVVEKLGQPNLAQKLLDAWIAEAKKKDEYRSLTRADLDIDFVKFHPTIQSALKSIVAAANPPLSLVITIEKISDERSWRERERIALEQSTVTDYEAAIRSLKGPQLRTLLLTHLEWDRNEIGTNHFPIAVGNFKQACKNIYTNCPTTRLSEIIFRTFSDNNRASLLT